MNSRVELYEPDRLQFGTGKGSGTLLVRLYKDAGTPAIECSPTKFFPKKALEMLFLANCDFQGVPTNIQDYGPPLT